MILTLLGFAMASESGALQAAPQLGDFQDLVTEMIENGDTNNDILLALRAHGVKTSLSRLKAKQKEWDLRRPGRATKPITDALAERVKYHFFHTRLNDERIAIRLGEEGFQT